MSECAKRAKLHDFVAGELDDAAADEFRLHLGECDSCPGELGELLQLTALEELAAKPVATQTSTASPVDELAARRRKRLVVVATASVLAAAAAIAFVVLRGDNDSAGSAPLLALSTEPNRSLELRVSAADDHRPYEVMRSGERPVAKIPLATLAKLEKRGEKQRLANAHLLMREPEKADALLAELKPTASVLADRGVAATLRGDNHAALRMFAESLELEPNNSRVLWNQAIVYRELNLPLSAAKLFTQVAELGEPGWSEEAAKQAAALQGALEATESYKKAFKDGSGQIAEGKVLALGIVSRYPGLGRLLFYDAVRSATSTEALAALKPHALALDKHYGTTECSRAIFGVEAGDWEKRSALAARYAVLTQSQRRDREGHALALDAIRVGQSDIAYGALVYSGRMDAETISTLKTIATESDDLWLTLLAEERELDAMIAARHFHEAETRLREVMSRCESGAVIAYRCTRLATRELRVQQALYKIRAARAAATRAIKWATEVEDVYELSNLRQFIGYNETLADEASGASLAMARALLSEELLTGLESCAEEFVVQVLSDLSFRDNKLVRAAAEDRRAEKARLACGYGMDTGTAYMRARILSATGGDEVGAFRKTIAAARPKASELEKAEYDLAEGRVLLRTHPSEAESLLRRSIKAIESMPSGGVKTRQVRSLAYAFLGIGKSERGNHAGALAEFSAEANLEVPSRCAVALAFEFRLAVVIVDSGGAVSGRYSPDYTLEQPPLVAAELARLKACDVVSVIARAPFFGRIGLLPDEMAWRFVQGARVSKSSTKARRVVIADVLAPKQLGLPPLQPWAGPAADELITGAAATPERVLEAFRTSTEVEVHAHGLLASTTDDGFLALSANASGDYRLTAGKISDMKFEGAPLVILGACNAARNAAYLHEPWGLPNSLRQAGARTIIASPNPIPDSSSSAFFAAVRKNMLAGASAAVAVRDARMEWRARAQDAGRWAAEVLVFE